MRSLLVIFALVLTAGNAVGAADRTTPLDGPPALGPRPLKIGYADLTRILKASRRRRDLEAELKQFQRSLGVQDRSRVAEITALREEKEQLAMGTPEYGDLDKKERRKLRDLEEWRKRTYDLMNRRFVDLIEDIYAEIVRDVTAIAKEGDFDFVIKEQSQEIRPRSREEAVLQVSQRVVLYSKPEYDLTRVVVTRMNQRYALEKEKAKDAKRPAEAPPEER